MTCRPVCLAEGAQRGRRLLAHDAVAGEDDRLARALDDLGGAQQAHGVGLDHRLRAARQRRADDRRAHDVLGQLEMRGARLLRGGDAERLAHGLGHHARVVDARVPLGHGAQHVDRVDELVRRLFVHAGQAGLAGDGDQWGVVQVGVADAGGEVARARAEGRQTHARAPGEAAVGVGHEGRSLLVPRGHEGDELRAVERLAQVQRLLAGDAEHELDPLVLQAVDEEVGRVARILAGGRGRKDGVGAVGHVGFESSSPVLRPASADRWCPACSDGQGAVRPGAPVRRERAGSGAAGGALARRARRLGLGVAGEGVQGEVLRPGERRQEAGRKADHAGVVGAQAERRQRELQALGLARLGQGAAQAGVGGDAAGDGDAPQALVLRAGHRLLHELAHDGRLVRGGDVGAVLLDLGLVARLRS